MKASERSFKTINDLELIVKHKKSAIILEIGNNNDSTRIKFELIFNKETFKELYKYIKEAASESWDNIKPREAYSLGSDYNEYYDRKFDTNGYLDIRACELQIERPTLESNKLYQFNKSRIETFLNDFAKIVD